MDAQIIIALCEGPHDVAFLNKLFKTKGFVSNEKSKLEEYPKPMSNLLIKEAVKSDVEGLNIQEVRNNLLPANALIKGDVHILLYALGGDGKKDKRKDFIRKIKSTIVLPGEIRQGRETHNVLFGVIYFFDADNQGVQNRLASVKTELKQINNSIPDADLSTNASLGIYEGIKFGCYIFSGDDNNKGKLEDILLPIMKGNNDEIFKWAGKFLDYFHNGDRLFPLKLKSEEGGMIEERSQKLGDKYHYDKNKSLIGAIGQLQQSGGSNTVCIGFTDYLTLPKIQSNQKCQDILIFLNNFINYPPT